jgi:hypothetical protein
VLVRKCHGNKGKLRWGKSGGCGASGRGIKQSPEADHDAMYQDAVARMRVYLNEDRKGADTSAKRMVPACQQTYRKMASEGTLTRDQIKTAKDASRESVAKLIEEMQAQGYSVQQ